MFEGARTSGPFHGDEWLFSSVLLPSYEKGDLVIGRLYEAIKNVCQSAASNAIPKRGRGVGGVAGMVKRPFTVPLNGSLTALLHLSDNVLVVRTIFYSLSLSLSPHLHFESRGGEPAFPRQIHSTQPTGLRFTARRLFGFKVAGGNSHIYTRRPGEVCCNTSRAPFGWLFSSDRRSIFFSYSPTSTCDTDAINHTCRLFNKYANLDQLNGVTAFAPLINNERLCLIALVFMYKLFKLANNNAGRARRIWFYPTLWDYLRG